MKGTAFIWIIILVFVNTVNAQIQTEIAGLGNGLMSVYEDKADIIQVFGPPYSSPSSMRIVLSADYSEIKSEREYGRAIWQYSLIEQEDVKAIFTDFVIPGIPGFIRKIQSYDTVVMTLEKPENHIWINNSINFQDHIRNAIIAKVPVGSFYYGFYPITHDLYQQLLVEGNIIINQNETEYTITCMPGESFIYIVGGENYKSNVLNVESLLSKTPDEWLEKTRSYWDEFTARRKDFTTQLKGFHDKDRLIQTIDNIAILLKTQQSAEGAIIAGHNFHMGYVRDQYGASRGLLAMGYHEEAKDILQYYWSIWKKEGVIKNAQGVGMVGFHVHENDDVEITGYLIIQAFDYLKETGDNEFINKIFPMLEWAWQSQTKHLIRDMLPFNGDETYIAGHILPRTTINDGSSESTLLFITGGELLLNWIEDNNKWEKAHLSYEKHLLSRVMDNYFSNFIDDKGLLTNNPLRIEGVETPLFRHGVCEARLEGCQVVDWTQKNINNRYLCFLCYPKTEMNKVTPEKFYIQSVTLTPFYLHSQLFDNNQKLRFLKTLTESYRKTGKMPSRPEGDITVGYDYGLFLYALTEMKDPLKDKIYHEMMRALDKRGVWVEYYENNSPMGTRYRPWESGINIDAAIRYALLNLNLN